jgi:hypothetical protein
MSKKGLWIRSHRNNWTAIVSPDDDGWYSAGAHEGGLGGHHWAHRVEELEPAKQLADADVPEHDCDCPDWTATIPR